MYIKAVQATLKSKDKVLETQNYPAIDNKALSIKSRAREIKIPTDKAHRIKNRVDKDKALSTKNPTMFKGVIKKHSLESNPSGYLQSEGFITQKKALTLY